MTVSILKCIVMHSGKNILIKLKFSIKLYKIQKELQYLNS